MSNVFRLLFGTVFVYLLYSSPKLEEGWLIPNIFNPPHSASTVSSHEDVNQRLVFISVSYIYFFFIVLYINQQSVCSFENYLIFHVGIFHCLILLASDMVFANCRRPHCDLYLITSVSLVSGVKLFHLEIMPHLFLY